MLNTVLAEAIHEIYESEIDGIIHFSSLDAISRFEFGIMMADIFDFNKENIHPAGMEDMPWKAKRPKDSSLNNDRALKTMTRKPITVSQESNLIRGMIESDE